MTPESRYCRTCGYDLRGQIEPRCPECATGFDPQDPTTFYSKPVTRVRKLTRTIQGRPFLIPTLLAFTLGAYYAVNLFTARFGCDSSPSPYGIDQMNLKSIMTSWKIALNDVPDDPNRALEAALLDCSPSLSVRTQWDAIIFRLNWRERCEGTAAKITPVAVYGLLLVLLCRARIRRAGKLIFFAAAMLIIVCVMHGAWLNLLAPKTLDYLNDYVFLPDADWSNRSASATVAAFEKPPRGRRLLVGFTDGHVNVITTGEFRSLAQQQGFSDRLPP